MDDFYFEESSESDREHIDDYFCYPPPNRCNCNQINKERYEIWVNNTTFQERFESMNNPESTVKQPPKIKCKECLNLSVPCLAS